MRHSTDPSQYFGGLWSGNFYPALRELGHEIVESRVDLEPASRFMDIAGDFTKEEFATRTNITEQILDEVRAAHRQSPLDLFLGYFYNAHFDPAGFDELRRLGVPSVNFYCNSTHQFDLVAAVAAKVDFAWHVEKEARHSYLAVGANPVWVQMGADPNLYAPRPNSLRASKACFVGQRYADRDRWVAALIRAKVPIDIYGMGWGAAVEPPSASSAKSFVYLGRRRPMAGTLESYAVATRDMFQREGQIQGAKRLIRQWQYRRETKLLSQLFETCARGPIPYVRDVFSSYEVCLNFSNVWSDGMPGSKLIPHVRLRDFEAPMCRAAYITGYTDEIAEFYELGTEIETYRSDEELVDKIRFYLANPLASERLRDAGHIRALRDHTWRRRFEKLFQKIAVQ